MSDDRQFRIQYLQVFEYSFLGMTSYINIDAGPCKPKQPEFRAFLPGLQGSMCVDSFLARVQKIHEGGDHAINQGCQPMSFSNDLTMER